MKCFFLPAPTNMATRSPRRPQPAAPIPKTYVDRISGLFRSTWDRCGIAYDHFIRTTDSYHKEYVQRILQKIYDAGDVYFGEYGGFYCYGCERFYTEKELVDGKCPDHQTAPDYISEKNYFFRMAKYQERLIDEMQVAARSHPPRALSG